MNSKRFLIKKSLIWGLKTWLFYLFCWAVIKNFILTNSFEQEWRFELVISHERASEANYVS